MCGIAGFHGRGTQADLALMTRALAHRGPDGEGFYIDTAASVFLGHRRLAIIDIAGGAQPMANDDGSTVITFNGEIYNHRELRKDLERMGQVFKSGHSDTEVIVRGYDVWGDAVADRLDGMFAFAIYDAKRQRIVLGRDRFGEKPLFYTTGSHGLVFASELPGLRMHPAAAAHDLDPAALQKLFAYSFLPGVMTPHRSIRKLLPGSLLTYDCQTQNVSERRFWRFSIEAQNPPAGTINDWTDELTELLQKAVSSRLESDVPLGIFLSGGLDSSAIAALAACAAGASRTSTFTIGFKEKSFDESDFARLVADRLGTSHTTEICDSVYLRESAPRILSRVGDLLGDPSLIPTYLLAGATRRHVTVALSGDGGDELFGGYDPFKVLSLARAYKTVTPRPVHNALRVFAARFSPSERYMSLEFKVSRALRGLSYTQSLWNPVWLGALSPHEISQAFDAPLPVEDLYSEAIEEWDRSVASHPVDRTLEFFTNLYLPDDILVKSDRASMLHGLEVRAPFLARDIAEFARRLPHDVKVRRGETKWILKRAVARLLPAEIVKRRKKGFGIPVSRWLRDSGPHVWSPVPGIKDQVFKAWSDEHFSRKGDHRSALWCRLVVDALVRSPAAGDGQRPLAHTAADAKY